jgi:ferredoxin-NADP reductase
VIDMTLDVGRTALPPLPPRLSTVHPRDVQEPNATFVRRSDLSDAVARFVVRPDGPLEFRPGQYVSLGLWVGDRFVERPYSIASAGPSADRIEFLVRRVPGGALTPSLWRASPGTRVHLGRPKGRLALAEDDHLAHLFIASGTGLAPFLGMLRQRAAAGRPLRAVLIHGVSRREDLAARAELQRWQQESLIAAYVPTVSRVDDPGNTGWTGRQGRAEAILAEVLDETGLDPDGTVAYLCGNPGMVDTSEGILRSRGFAPGAIRAERYWTTSASGAAEVRPEA